MTETPDIIDEFDGEEPMIYHPTSNPYLTDDLPAEEDTPEGDDDE